MEWKKKTTHPEWLFKMVFYLNCIFVQCLMKNKPKGGCEIISGVPQSPWLFFLIIA